MAASPNIKTKRSQLGEGAKSSPEERGQLRSTPLDDTPISSSDCRRDELAKAEIAAKISSADLDELLLSYLPTVRYMARKIHEGRPHNVELDDLISAGVVGLIEASSKFDYTKKVQFKSYAQFCIRAAILGSLRKLDWSPRELRRKSRVVEEAIRSAAERLGRAPAQHEIAAEMEMTLDDFQQLLGDLEGLEIASPHIRDTNVSGSGNSAPAAILRKGLMGPAQEFANYSRLVARVVDAFGDELKASRWLSLPNGDLGGETPLQTAERDGYRGLSLEPILIRIEHGIYY